MKKNGFTLIELMVVIVIIGVLAAITIPKFSNISNDAKIAKVQGNLVNIRTSIQMYRVATEELPSLDGYEDRLDESVASNGMKFTDFFTAGKIPSTPAWEGSYADNAKGRYAGRPDYVINETNDVKNNPIIEPNGELTQHRGQGGWWYYNSDGRNHGVYRGDIYAKLQMGAYGRDDVDWFKY